MAVWLLNRVSGSETSTESLTGDLLEEYRRGRSAWWLWTQVFAAIAITSWREIWAHKLAGMGGIVTGFASLWCFATLATLSLTRIGFPHAADWRWPQGFVILAVGFGYGVISGWIVGRLHHLHRIAAVFSFLAAALIAPMIELPLLYWFAPSVFFATVVPMLPMALVATYIAAPVAILIGGFWQPHRQPPPYSAR
jgi:hypothetical protein